MVRAYARAVGLDPQEIVGEFLKVFPEADHLDGHVSTPAQQRLRHTGSLGAVHPAAATPDLVAVPAPGLMPTASSAVTRSFPTRGAVMIVAILGTLLASLAWYAGSDAGTRGEPAAQISAPEGADLAHARVGIDVARMDVARRDAAPSDVTRARAEVAPADHGAPPAAAVVQAAPETVAAPEAMPPISAPLAATSGGFVITTNPAGARVTIDGIGWARPR